MSIIYNVTIKVDDRIAEEWIEWLKEVHIPEVLGTGCFQDYTLVRLLEVDDTEGPTYAVMYKAASRADFNRYIEIHAEKMRQRSFDKWGDQFLAFRSVLQVVQ